MHTVTKWLIFRQNQLQHWSQNTMYLLRRRLVANANGCSIDSSELADGMMIARGRVIVTLFFKRQRFNVKRIKDNVVCLLRWFGDLLWTVPEITYISNIDIVNYTYSLLKKNSESCMVICKVIIQIWKLILVGVCKKLIYINFMMSMW